MTEPTASPTGTGDTLLAPHFALSEFWRSASHPELTERPPLAAIDRLRVLARTVLEPLRHDLRGAPIRVLSGYRSPALNRAVGGSMTSQHVLGEAADIRVLAMTPVEVLRHLMVHEHRYPVGQVIAYPDQGFVHVALPGYRYRRPNFFVHRRAYPKQYKPVVSLRHLDTLFPPTTPLSPAA